SFLKQYAETRGFMLGRPQKPKITPDGKAVLFLRADGKTPKLGLFEFDVASGKTRELLTPDALLKNAEEKLDPQEKARRERQRVSVGGFTDFHLDPTGNRVLLKLSNRLYVFDRTTGTTTELKTGEGGAVVDPKWSLDGKMVAYVRGFDVYVYDLAAGKETPVKTGGEGGGEDRGGRIVGRGGGETAKGGLVGGGRQVDAHRGGGCAGAG